MKSLLFCCSLNKMFWVFDHGWMLVISQTVSNILRIGHWRCHKLLHFEQLTTVIVLHMLKFTGFYPFLATLHNWSIGGLDSMLSYLTGLLEPFWPVDNKCNQLKKCWSWHWMKFTHFSVFYKLFTKNTGLVIHDHMYIHELYNIHLNFSISLFKSDTSVLNCRFSCSR